MVKKEHVSLLRENESLKMTLHRHWIILIFHFFYLIILVIISSVLLNFQDSIMSLIGGWLYWWMMSLFWIVFLTFMFLDWINDELDLFIVTDSRIIWIDQQSALSRVVSECSLDRVQEVNAQVSGIWQTLFNFWDVHIHTASEHSNMIVRYAPDPVENARRINNIIQEYRKSHENRT